MAVRDRRPKKSIDRLQNVKYRSLWQSDGWNTLKELIDILVLRWSLEEDAGTTMDDFTMHALRRVGRIQGVKMVLKEIERLANEE